MKIVLSNRLPSGLFDSLLDLIDLLSGKLLEIASDDLSILFELFANRALVELDLGDVDNLRLSQLLLGG